jgi:hypothetical protein
MFRLVKDKEFAKAKELATIAELNSHIDVAGIAMRKNIRKAIRDATGVTKIKESLASKITEQVLKLSKLEIARSTLKTFADYAPLSENMAPNSSGFSFLLMNRDPRNYLPSEIKEIDADKLKKIVHDYQHPEVFYNAQNEISTPRRLRAKILLKDSDMLLLNSIHKKYMGSRATGSARFTIAEISENLEKSINGGSLGDKVIAPLQTSPAEKERLLREGRARLSTLNIDILNDTEIPFFRL